MPLYHAITLICSVLAACRTACRCLPHAPGCSQSRATSRSFSSETTTPGHLIIISNGEKICKGVRPMNTVLNPCSLPRGQRIFHTDQRRTQSKPAPICKHVSHLSARNGLKMNNSCCSLQDSCRFACSLGGMGMRCHTLRFQPMMCRKTL